MIDTASIEFGAVMLAVYALGVATGVFAGVMWTVARMLKRDAALIDYSRRRFEEVMERNAAKASAQAMRGGP